MSRITMKEIKNATDQYVYILQEFDISSVIDSFFEERKDHIVIPYPGLVKEYKDEKDQYSYRNSIDDEKGNMILSDYSKYFQRSYDNKICLGILSFIQEHDECDENCEICESGESHYVAFVKTKKSSNKIYVFDSASTDPKKDDMEIMRFLRQKTFGSGYIIEGLKMEKELQPSAGATKDIINSQNIFCHTWCLWFFKELSCLGIDKIKEKLLLSGKNIDETLYNVECLSTIKKFGMYLLINYFSTKEEILSLDWIEYFNYIKISSKSTINIKDYIIVTDDSPECWYKDIQHIYGDLDDIPLKKRISAI